MDRPELYSECNSQAIAAAREILNEYADKIQWRKDYDSAIDLGCGDGGVTTFLKNQMPCKDCKFVAVDINERMVKFAKENHREDNITFRVLDVGGIIPEDLKSGFNHVFSFFTLHIIKDQKKVFQNIYDLLANGGDCMLLIVKDIPFYDMFIQAAQQSKWSSTWIKDLNIFFSPYYQMQDPEKRTIKILENIGFTDIHVQCKKMTYPMKNGLACKNLMKAIEPYKMPDDVFEEFALESVKVAQKMGILDETEMKYEDRQSPVHYNFEMLVVCARKS